MNMLSEEFSDIGCSCSSMVKEDSNQMHSNEAVTASLASKVTHVKFYVLQKGRW